MVPAPVQLTVEAVTSDAGLVADNGAPRTDQPVKQGGLAHVGTADDHDRRPTRAMSRICAGIFGALAQLHFFRHEEITPGTSGSKSATLAEIGVVLRRAASSRDYYRDSVSSYPQAASAQTRRASGEQLSLSQFFGPGGLLSKTHPAYEFRRGQLQMAQEV